MDECVPLTASQPWEELPLTGSVQTLFPELPAPGMRPVEVTVTLPDGHCGMHIVVPEDNAPQALALALEACRGLEEFEVTARRYTG